MFSEYGNVDCTTVSIKLVGSDLYQIAWTNPIIKVKTYQIDISFNGSSVYNASIPGTQNSLNLTNLEFNTMYNILCNLIFDSTLVLTE